MPNLEISTDKNQLDRQFIHSFIKRSYWSPNIPFDTLSKAIDHSICFGVYLNGQQIGFARVITDHAVFAYLSDVFIIEEHQGKGYSKKLIAEIMAHPDLQGLKNFSLNTKDAHSLYEKFGFTEFENPFTLMSIMRPDIYSN